MLEYLHIRNLALIEDMELEFSEGINALTGETGAGKSFILKALSFLLGDKLNVDMVRPGAERAQVDALFHIGDEELVLRRELGAGSGRSRFYINDALSSKDAIEELRRKLISHTSQHAQQQLLQPAFQARLLENGIARPDLLQKRDELVENLKNIDSQIDNLRKKQKDLAEKRDLLEMQKEEIDKVSPREGEEEELEGKRAKAREMESARHNYNKAMGILYGEDTPGLLQMLADFEKLLGNMAKGDGNLANDAECVEVFRQQMAELANQFRRPPGGHKFDMDAVEERLFVLAQLKRKLRRTLPQILKLKEEIKQNLSFLDVCALDLSHLSKEKTKIKEELENVLAEIKPLREEAGKKFASNLEEQLKDLGFSEHARVLPDFAAYEIYPGISDERGRILWAPNPGQRPQPLDKIASGGELSRFLLALSTLNKDDGEQTYIFDEVDAGVGGLTLTKVGEKLRKFSKDHQIILITHWPQLAARASKHFHISKIVKDENTFTLCSPLSGKDRENELARMAGGGKEGKMLVKEIL